MRFSPTCLPLIALLAISLRTPQARAQKDDKDPLLAHLVRIEAKLDELNATISDLKSTGAAGSCGCSSLTATRLAASLVDEQLEADQLGQPRKRETKEESLAARDLFHFNKLAHNLNAIPSSSGSPQDSSNQQEQQHVLAQSMVSAQDRLVLQSEKRLLLSLGHLQESMLGEALDGMNSILKQHLTSFKTTLTKVSNRLADHTYQHHVLADQVSMARDECSLAVARQTCANLNASSPPQQQVQQPDELTMTSQTLRSSEAMLIRRLSDELTQSLQSSLPPSGGCRSSSDTLDVEQERHLRHESELARELKQFQRRMDEIDSVVKQSALLLNKLANQERPRAQTYVTHTPAESNQPPSATNSSASVTLLAKPTRWFAGSKVPNQRQGSSVNYAGGHQEGASASSVRTCQAKTSLVRPSDCRQLREAGANCSGQYYIFAGTNSIRHVLCDMNSDSSDDGGGWTLIMRRIDKSLVPIGELTSGEGAKTLTAAAAAGETPRERQMSLMKARWFDEIYASQVDFGQDWLSYKGGFGALERWWEFFIGLDLVHQLTSVANGSSSGGVDLLGVELQVDLVANNSHELHLRFEDFHLGSESDQYELRVGPCNASQPTRSEPNLCSPISRLNGTKFFTHDKLAANNCSSMSNQPQGGWWLPLAPTSDAHNNTSACPTPTPALKLTDPVGRVVAPAGVAEQRHLFWPGWPRSDRPEPLRQVVLKVRQRRRRARNQNN